MSTRNLPPNPSLDQLKKQAKDLLKGYRSGDAQALLRLRASVSKLAAASDAEIQGAKFGLLDAQRVLALEYGFESWPALENHVGIIAHSTSRPAYSVDDLIAFFEAILRRHVEAVRAVVERQPTLVHARILAEHNGLRGPALHEAIRRQPLPLSDLERSRTALHLMAWIDHEDAREICRLLLAHGADVNALGFEENNGRCAPIVLASWEAGPEMTRLLLEGGADVRGQEGLAALNRGGDQYDLLEEYGAPSTVWTHMRVGFTERVIEAVDQDPSLLSHKDEHGYTLVQRAAGHMDRYRGGGPQAGRAITQALMDRGGEMDIFVAAALDDVDSLRQFLQAEPTRANEALGDGKTPLGIAVDAGSYATLSALLQAGADPNRKEDADPYRVNYLHSAAILDDAVACRLLLEHGAKVNDKAVTGAAWGNSDPAALAVLLEYGGDPNAMSEGWGTIHWASWANAESVKLLVDAGADLNVPAPGRTDDTPLHFAAGRGKNEIVQVLLAAGADPTRRNANGETALELAIRKGQAKAAELLQMAREE
ncbi:MAG: hypothetical protein GKR89_36365 [Candidatus Latescibacteria bacterium]|nr:hypothetical protein [Candidatus Latescibacterota bacterium]